MITIIIHTVKEIINRQGRTIGRRRRFNRTSNVSGCKHEHVKKSSIYH